MSVSVRLLGTLEADVDGASADLGGPRQRSVLALLLVARGEVVSVDRLIDDLWNGEPPPRAMGALQAYMSNLRRALEPARAPRTPSVHLVSAAPGYAVRFDTDAVDAWHFEDLLRTARDAADPAAAVSALERALGLWRGAAFAEFAAEPWAGPEAARLEELRTVARERLVDGRIRAGRSDEAVVDAEALVRELPLREEGWRLLALSQYLGGRQGDALTTLRTARRTLSDELGVDPGPRLAELEQDVLAQRVEAPPAPVPVAAVPVAAVPTPVADAIPEAGLAGSETRFTPAGGFVGRIRELAVLRGAATLAVPGSAAVALIAGEPGAGKSALLGRLRDELVQAGWRVTSGRCPEDEGGPPARAWAETVRELARQSDPGRYAEGLGPLLADDLPGSSEHSALVRRFQLHRSVHDWFASLAERPLAVLLDDVHRADGETRTLLAGLLDQGLPQRTLFVLAYRPDVDEGLADLLATLARYAPTRIRLAGLADSEVAELVAGVTGLHPDPALIRALAARTDGNPFYLQESARLLASEGELVATSHVPEGVADVLRRRLARLPAESVSVLRLASVIGRDVDVALLIEAAEAGEDAVLDALETGLVSGLLLEPSAETVRFSHLLVRETLYGGVPQLRRVRWHARVADAVARLYPGDLVALAHHSARSASAATATEAARRCVAAAELARARFAFDTEAELYLEAQRCLTLALDADPAEQVGLLVERVQALIRSGNTSTAARVRLEAVRIARAGGDPVLLADAVSAASIPALRGTLRNYAEMDRDLVAIIEAVLESDLDPVRRCRTLVTLARETSSMDDPRCAAALDEALALAREIGDVNLIGVSLTSAIEEFPADASPQRHREVLEGLREIASDEHPIFQVGWRVMSANAAASGLRLDEAQEHVDEVRAIARRYQLRQGVFIADAATAMLAHLRGEPERAEQLYEQAYATQVHRGTVDAGAALLLARVTVHYTQGRLGELAEQIRRAYENSLPALAHLLGLALVEAGDLTGARRVVEQAPPVLHDYLFLVIATMRGLTVAAVGDRERAPELYDELLPYADHVAGASSNAFALVPVAKALSQLAVLLDRPDDARRHAERFRAVALRCGSAPWITQAEQALAHLAGTRAQSR